MRGVLVVVVVVMVGTRQWGVWRCGGAGVAQVTTSPLTLLFPPRLSLLTSTPNAAGITIIATSCLLPLKKPPRRVSSSSAAACLLA